jgi:hypothetical protein
MSIKERFKQLAEKHDIVMTDERLARLERRYSQRRLDHYQRRHKLGYQQRYPRAW